MLPVFILEDIEHETPGAYHWPGQYVRTVMVCDGDRLIDKKQQRPLKEQQRALLEHIASISTAVYCPLPHQHQSSMARQPFNLSIWPVSHAREFDDIYANDGLGDPLAAIAVQVDRRARFRSMPHQRPSDFLTRRSLEMAQAWQHHTGEECTALSLDANMAPLRYSLNQLFPSANRHHFIFKGESPHFHRPRPLQVCGDLPTLLAGVQALMPRSTLEASTLVVNQEGSGRRL